MVVPPIHKMNMDVAVENLTQQIGREIFALTRREPAPGLIDRWAMQLGMRDEQAADRRVAAVLTYLRATAR